MTIQHPVGEEWASNTVLVNQARLEYVRVYLTVTDAQGRLSIRTENDSDRPCPVRIVDDTGTARLTVNVPAGFWPGPTAADKQSLGQVRLSQITGVSLGNG